MPTPDAITVAVNGQPLQVARGTTAAAAFALASAPCRLSTTGDPRSGVCGMGICFECRAIVDGVRHVRTCQLPCYDGMKLETQQ